MSYIDLFVFTRWHLTGFIQRKQNKKTRPPNQRKPPNKEPEPETLACWQLETVRISFIWYVWLGGFTNGEWRDLNADADAWKMQHVATKTSRQLSGGLQTEYIVRLVAVHGAFILNPFANAWAATAVLSAHTVRSVQWLAYGWCD